MHFEILVEDASGKKALEILVPKIVGKAHSFTVHAYKGIGRIPRNMKGAKEARNQMLLNNLPKLLNGYGNTFAGYSKEYSASLFIVCDLDNRCLKEFRTQLLEVLSSCHRSPETRFCVAIEEGEAWLLGDRKAVKAGYPKAKDAILDSYINDSICGTWEKLADAVVPGGAASLSVGGWHEIGREKSTWAERIAPHMDVEANDSPSFCYFRDKMRELADVRLLDG